MDLALGRKSNDPFKILASLRLEMEAVHKQVINSSTVNKMILEEEILFFKNQIQELFMGEGSQLSPDIIEFTTKWNHFKREHFKNQGDISFSIALVDKATKNRYLFDKAGNAIDLPTADNFNKWLQSTSDYLKFETPLLGSSFVEKNGNMVNFNFSGKIAKEISQSFITKKIQQMNLLEYADIELTSLQGSFLNKISIKISNISLLRPNELKSLVAFFEGLEGFFEKDYNQFQSFNVSRDEAVAYLKKRSRKISQRIDTLEKKEVFIRKAYNDFYKIKTRSLDMSDWLMRKTEISEPEVIQIILQVFPNLSADEKAVLTKRQKKMFDDFINNINLSSGKIGG